MHLLLYPSAEEDNNPRRLTSGGLQREHQAVKTRSSPNVGLILAVGDDGLTLTRHWVHFVYYY